jgi:hypothetical protein
VQSNNSNNGNISNDCNNGNISSQRLASKKSLSGFPACRPGKRRAKTDPNCSTRQSSLRSMWKGWSSENCEGGGEYVAASINAVDWVLRDSW